MPSKQYYAPESAITFAPSGGTEPITMTSLANGAGRISDQLDRGGGSKPGLYTIQIKTKAAAALAVGVQLRAYLIESSVSADVPGNLGVSDAAVSSEDKLRNLGAPVATINADSTSNGEVQISSAIPVFILSRYISVAVWNALGQALSGTAGDHVITLVPTPAEMQ